ncbi:DUF1542 domain-containing protein, partial [Streptococcus sp. D2]|uniref:DUF1542 domain-containing protein n=1 Tax=Streptococcus sp. D2 TaxID=2589787 RepID=UPI001127AC4A
MEHKNPMSRVERLHREKVTRYSIRKYSFGAASVAVAALFMFLGNGAVSANELSKQDTPSVEASAPASENKPTSEEATAKPAEAVTPALNKTQLESYISEIETKLSNGSYDNKTEESVAVLKADLESAKATLANATTQAELKKAYSKLVTTANTKLKNKPVEKKETPAVDTTNGKETVGKKAENTEKKSESNSIENTGSKDERNGQALDKNNAFRAETPETQGNFTYSMEYSNSNKKEIYLYNEEDADIDITVNSTAGDITKATVKSGSGQFLLKSKRDAVKAGTKPQPVEEENEIDGFGWTYRQTLTSTKGPVTIKITGKPNDEFKGLSVYKKTEDQNAVLGARYLQLENSNGEKLAAGSNLKAPGGFNLVVKSQTYKYDIQPVAEENKVPVADINSLTAPEITKIKEKIKIQYSDTATREDARLASHKGEVLANRSSVVKNIDVASGTVTVTYNDDSVDTTPVANVARVNAAPTVEIPFSVDGKKDVYVYANEDFDIPIKFKDDNGKVASATITRGGNVEQPPKDALNPNILNNEFNTTVEKISTETVATAETPAIVKIKGNISKDNSGISASLFPKTAEGELKIVTRYATATDTDGAYIKNTATEQAYASDPGSFTIKLKAQTAKYDIKDPETKVTVANANNITEDEFNQIKNSIKIQYSTTNPDKNLTDKQGKDVENQNERIESITREGNNVVVTYKDGSKDTKALADFVNVAPKVALPYSNEANKQIYVYTGENTDLTFKGTDENEVKDLYLRGPGDISGNNAAGYGLPTGKVENGAVTGEGSVSEDKRTATIKMTGKTNLPAGQQWTSFIVSKDNDGKLSNTDYRALDKDPNARQKPGYAHFLVKNQTFKYDIATPTEKVAVTDPANVTQDELDKIKEKLQIEYSKRNDDANLAEKKGKAVDAEDAKTKIKSVEKDANGNLVVTYTDGSKDTRSLSEFVTLDKQPAIEAVEKAAEAKIDEINKTPNATDDEKQAAIDKVNADKKKALDEIAKPEVTTKEALDTAKTAGTTAIVGDNPVVAKKDAAKADVETARKAKEDAIKANPNLTQAEKDAAIAKNNTAAEEATKAIDSATTNDAVDKAKEAGTGEIAKVNPVAKAAAKKAVADELAEKEKAIDARTDLTDAEKTAAKDDAKAKAKAATDAINAQPDNAETPEAATTAQTAVNNAKDKGVADVKAVNPVAKEAAKKAVADELAEKEKAIDARTDLTDAEKTAAKDDAKAKAKAATDAIDAQPSNAATPEEAATAQTAVNGAKDKGVADVKAVNPVAKEAAKKAIADELAKKEKAIDGRTDLTDEEKAAAKDDAKAKAKEATDAIDAQPSNAATPEEAAEAQTAVNGAKDKGVVDVKAVDPAAAKKPEAKKAVDDALKAKVAAIDAREDLTPAEKQTAKDKAAAEAKKATDAIDAATTDAAVDTAKDAGTGAVEAINPEAKAKPEAKKAIDDALKAKEDAIDARTDLTDDEKKAAKEAAKEAADKAKAAIDAAPSNAEVDKAKEAGTGEIAKVNPVAKEAAKKAVADELAKKEAEIAGRNDLTDEEKAKAKEEAQAKAKEATDAIDAQPSNAETPEKAAEAQTAVDGAKDKGVADVTAVNPAATKKPEAKKAIDDALKAKEAAIDARTDLTDDEKKAAKDAAKDAADKAKEAIDAAPSDAEVDKAKEAGTGAVEAINPEAKAKPEAKQAIDDALKAKEAAIDARTDLTDDEKKAAKDAAKDAADKAKEAIDAAPSNAEVDKAKEAGTGAVEAINPEAKAKPEAKQAIDDALKAKEAAIDARTDLTDDEKKAAKDAAKDAADKAKEAIDAAPSNAEVDKAKEAGTGEIAKVNPVAKEAAKKAVADELKAKEAEIAGRNDLTDEEKAKAKEEAQAKAKEATDAIDAQPSNAETPEKAAEAQTAVDGAKDKGVADVKAVDPEAKAKPVAKKAIEDKLAKQLEDIANTPDATDDEKKVAADAAKALAEGAKKEIDKAGTDAEVKQLQEEAEGEIEKSVPVVEDKPNARKAIEDEAKAKKEAIDARTDLTPKAKEDLKAQVDAIADQAKKSVDAAKTSEAVDGIEESDKAAIKAVGEVNIPADKVLVNNPSALTDDEKAKVLEAVKKVNPDAKEITQDADGNVTVTTPDGHKEIITPEQVVKTAATANDPKAGNDIVKPADKVVVNDPAKLTDAEKEKIKAAVEAVNPNSIVVVDDKGNAKVSTPDGQTQVIPVEELVRTVEDTKKPNAGNDIVKPADKTVVANPEKLTDTEKKAIEDKVKAVNPDATVVVDDKGNTTVTTPEGKTAVIPAADLTKDPETATKPNAGNDIVKPADKTAVKDPANLTPEEKKAIEDKVKAVNP